MNQQEREAKAKEVVQKALQMLLPDGQDQSMGLLKGAKNEFVVHNNNTMGSIVKAGQWWATSSKGS